MYQSKDKVFVDIYQEFNANLKKALKYAGNPSQLAKDLGMSRNVIYTWRALDSNPSFQSMQLVKNYVDNINPEVMREKIDKRKKRDIRPIVEEYLGDKE